MARMIDGDDLIKSLKNHRLHILMEDEDNSAAVFDDIIDWIEYAPTLTPPNASPDLISRAALLVGETEPEITTGSDSELAEHMEWDRWMDKIKRAPAVGKEAAP